MLWGMIALFQGAGRDISPTSITRTVAQAVRSVIGTNGVSDRLRRIEVEVEELRRWTASITRASDLETESAPSEAVPTIREPTSPGATMIDHNMMIHLGRGALLRAMPPGANRLLSAGCSGTWYFNWVRQCFGDVPEHLGIEYYTPRPDDLPANVSWIPNTVSDMSGVATASCDWCFPVKTSSTSGPPKLWRFSLKLRVSHGPAAIS
jgi:hypothetical protein